VGDALRGKLVGAGIVVMDSAGQLGAGEECVVGVGCVVPVEFWGSGVVVSLVTVELLLGVGVGSEDGAECFEGSLGSELGVQVVEDREVDQDLVGEVEAEVGLGAKVEEIELEVHPEDGVRVGEPAGEVLAVGRDVELEDEGGTGGEVGQVTIVVGDGDGYGLD